MDSGERPSEAWEELILEPGIVNWGYAFFFSLFLFLFRVRRLLHCNSNIITWSQESRTGGRRRKKKDALLSLLRPSKFLSRRKEEGEANKVRGSTKRMLTILDGHDDTTRSSRFLHRRLANLLPANKRKKGARDLSPATPRSQSRLNQVLLLLLLLLSPSLPFGMSRAQRKRERGEGGSREPGAEERRKEIELS